MKQLYPRSSNLKKNISFRESPTLSHQKQNNPNLNNLLNYRFQQQKRLSLKSNKTAIASIPLITSVSVTPAHQSPYPETITDDLLIKMSNYLLVTSVLIDEAEVAHTSSDSLLKQIRKLRQNLLILLDQHKAAFKSPTTFRKQENQQKLLERVRHLEAENQHLYQLMMKQEQFNVKLHLQMNDSQSKGIQHFKQKLQESYNSYKNLEDRVQNYQAQLQQMKNIKDLIQQENKNKNRTIQCLQQKVKRSSLKANDIKEFKQIKQMKEQEALRISSKRKSLKNEGINLHILRQRARNDILMPPFKSNNRNFPYTNPFQDNYLKCIRDQYQENSLHNLISE